MIVFAMIIVWLINLVIKEVNSIKLVQKGAVTVPTEKSNNKIKSQFSHSEYSNGLGIKKQISHIYESNIPNKREIIIDLLQRLNKYEDPGNFLEQHTKIHKYIFN